MDAEVDSAGASSNPLDSRLAVCDQAMGTGQCLLRTGLRRARRRRSGLPLQARQVGRSPLQFRHRAQLVSRSRAPARAPAPPPSASPERLARVRFLTGPR